MVYIIVRHNMPYVHKVFDVSVETLGITSSIDEAKTKVLEAINSEIDESNECRLDDDYEPHVQDIDFEVNSDESISICYDHGEMAFDIIPIEDGFTRYTKLAGV